MKTDRVKKINYGYLLAYILTPAALMALGLWIGNTVYEDGEIGAVACNMCSFIAAILLWVFGGRIVYFFAKKRMLKQLDGAGVDRRQIFYSDGCVVSVDAAQAKVALLFFWNPFALYVIPAGRVTRAWADDGAGGRGFLRGTSRVSFLFEVDGVKVRVNTFVSNQRWKLNDDKVLEGVSKADLWVQVLDQARQQKAGV